MSPQHHPIAVRHTTGMFFSRTFIRSLIGWHGPSNVPYLALTRRDGPVRTLLPYFPVADPMAMTRRVDTHWRVGTPWLNIGRLPSLIPNPILNPSSSVRRPSSFSSRISRPNRHPDRHLGRRTRSLYRESPHFGLQRLFRLQKRYHRSLKARPPNTKIQSCTVQNAMPVVKFTKQKGIIGERCLLLGHRHDVDGSGRGLRLRRRLRRRGRSAQRIAIRGRARFKEHDSPATSTTIGYPTPASNAHPTTHINHTDIPRARYRRFESSRAASRQSNPSPYNTFT